VGTVAALGPDGYPGYRFPARGDDFAGREGGGGWGVEGVADLQEGGAVAPGGGYVLHHLRRFAIAGLMRGRATGGVKYRRMRLRISWRWSLEVVVKAFSGIRVSGAGWDKVDCRGGGSLMRDGRGWLGVADGW
jgi:hypothetical protein